MTKTNHASLVLEPNVGPSLKGEVQPSPAPAFENSYVSVVIPCFNEERFIYGVLDQLAKQYDSNRYEIIIVDGLSTDRTREEVQRFIAANSAVHVRLVDNPSRHIPAGLNIGIASARGEIIVRMDAHSIPSPNYVRRCVESLTGTDASVIGMPWRIQPATGTASARAIALAVAHPFGIGDAKYRLHVENQVLVDTVPFGAFRKELWQSLGGFNESLLTNEDYEFNYRVRQAGGRILLDGTAHCVYYARSSFKELARQYFRYGFWKAQMLKLYPESIRWRHLVAPTFVMSVILLTLLLPALKSAGWLLLAAWSAYAVLALTSALQLTYRSREVRLLPHVFFSFLVIHTCWGFGFWCGMIRSRRGLRLQPLNNQA